MNSTLPRNEWVNISQLHHKNKYYFELHIIFNISKSTCTTSECSLRLEKLQHTKTTSYKSPYQEALFGLLVWPVINASELARKQQIHGQGSNPELIICQLGSSVFLPGHQHNVILFNVFCYL